MSELSESKLNILVHTTGWPKSYRNHYVAGPGQDQLKELEELVADEFMTKRRNHLNQVSEEYVFHITPKGVDALLKQFDQGDT